MTSAMPTRVLGRTGREVSILGLGGHHIGRPSNEKTGIKIIRKAIDGGVNFLDNAWCYHNGRSERIMGKALQDGYRDRVMLMTKNHGRDYDSYEQQLGESLNRLQTDHIDLVQFHEIISQGDPQKVFEQGAIDAAVDARDEGKISYIGFTGHKWPYLFKEMLDMDFDWDTVQMPVNVLDYHYRSFNSEIIPVLRERGIGIIGMKSMSGGRLVKAGITQPEENLRYALSMPISILVSGMGSTKVLEENLETARNFRPMSEDEIEALRSRTEQAAADGKHEYYKTRPD